MKQAALPIWEGSFQKMKFKNIYLQYPTVLELDTSTHIVRVKGEFWSIK